MIYYIKDSILNAKTKYVAHGVNCQNTMRSGVAKIIFSKYPKVKKRYHYYFKKAVIPFKREDKDLLGVVQFVDCKNKIFLNMFTQRFFGSRNDYNPQSFKYVSYDAIEMCFKKIVECGIKEISIPMIGSGKGGGDWFIIENIIKNTVKDKVKVYVYYL